MWIHLGGKRRALTERNCEVWQDYSCDKGNKTNGFQPSDTTLWPSSQNNKWTKLQTDGQRKLRLRPRRWSLWRLYCSTQGVEVLRQYTLCTVTTVWIDAPCCQGYSGPRYLTQTLGRHQADSRTDSNLNNVGRSIRLLNGRRDRTVQLKV